jgi:hypothetical protein
MGYDQHTPIKPQETRLSMRLTRALHCNTKSNQGAIEIWLLVYLPTNLKNDGVKVGWDYDIPKRWKVMKNSMVPVTTNQYRYVNPPSINHQPEIDPSFTLW